jgi:dihydroflavonol-4-reductase
VKRVVLTSSIAAIGLGHKEKNRTFTEEDWTNLNSKNNIPPYVQSKTIAESEAWKYVINPGYVLGPLLEKDFSDSAEIVRKLLAGEIPGLPKIKFPLVDVRDVAEMHLFICVNKSSSYLEIAKILKEGFPEFGKRIKTFELPDFFIRLYGLFDKETKTIRVELGRSRSYNNSKSVKMFGWKPP